MVHKGLEHSCKTNEQYIRITRIPCVWKGMEEVRNAASKPLIGSQL